MTPNKKLLLLLPLALSDAWAVEGNAPDLAQAEALLRAGQASAAWQLLEPYEAKRAGEQSFDYLLGLAALENGDYSRASFILERVVGENPDHAAAHLDLARALFAAGDYERARLEFAAASRYQPPQEAMEVIQRYLAAIDRRTATGKLRLSAYAEFGLGLDSNVNAGVSGGNYYMPALGATLESPARRARYSGMAAGVDLVLPTSQEQEFFAGIDLKTRFYQHRAIDETRNADYYDNRNLDARVGVQQRLDPQNALRVTAVLSQQTLDDTQAYRHSQSVQGEWRHAYDNSRQSTLWLLGQRNRYDRVNDTAFRQYNGNQTLAGLTLAQSFDANDDFVAQVGVQGGVERATDMAAGNLDGDKRIVGMRLGGQWRWRPEVHVLAGVGVTHSRYALTNVLFFDKRRDTLWDASLGALWRLSEAWSLRPQFVLSRSDSNLGAYDYVRKDYSLTLRYDFR